MAVDAFFSFFSFFFFFFFLFVPEVDELALDDDTTAAAAIGAAEEVSLLSNSTLLCSLITNLGLGSPGRKILSKPLFIFFVVPGPTRCL